MWGRTLGALVRAWIWASLVCFGLLVSPGAVATDFRIERGEDEQGEDGWRFSSEQGNVAGELVEAETGEHYAWELESGLDRLVGEVVAPAGHFDVERRRQVVPRVDDALFSPVSSPDRVDETENPSRVVNITRLEDGTFVYRVAFPGNADPDFMRFSLERDVDPPAHGIGPVQNLSHNSFYLETETDEPALATLWIWRSDAEPGDAVEHPTQTPSLTQRFPVRGLQPETGYRFHVAFEDWAGNAVDSEPVDLTTAAQVVGERPVIHRVVPEPDAVLPEPPEAIEAEFEPVDGTFGPEGVRLFLDLDEVTAQATYDEEGIRYAPSDPLEPGPHVVRLELVNSAGGETDMRWEFTVSGVESDETPAPVGSIFLTGMVVLFVLAVKRRRDASAAAR